MNIDCWMHLSFHSFFHLRLADQLTDISYQRESFCRVRAVTKSFSSGEEQFHGSFNIERRRSSDVPDVSNVAQEIMPYCNLIQKFYKMIIKTLEL